MRTHRLPVEHFAALAAGDGDFQTIHLLKRAELSRRLLQIRALLDHGDSVTECAYDQLIDVESKDPQAVADVILYPHVGAWVTRCLRLVGRSANEDSARELAHLGAVTAAAAIRAKVDITAHLPVRRGVIALPSLGCAVTGRAMRNGMAIARCRPNRTEIETDDRTIVVPADPRADAPGWRGVRTLRTSHDGHVLEVRLDDLDPFRHRDQLVAAPRLTGAEFVAWQRAFAEAWEILVTRHSDRARAIAAGLTAIVPLVHQGGSRGLSATAIDAFGAMAMTSPTTPTRLAETLVHEFQHAKLGALLDLVPLYDTAGDERYYAPWRDDPRPLGGLLQGVYAYLGVTDFWGRQLHSSADSAAATAEFEFALWRQQTKQVIESLLKSGRLTTWGINFAAGMRAALARWEQVSVHGDVRAVADDAAADHALVWRLRHVRPDHNAIDRLARARLEGGRPPEITASTTTVPTGEPMTPMTPMTAMARADLRLRRIQSTGSSSRRDGAEPAGEPIPSMADIACANGEYAAAARGYRSRLAAEPGDIESWAGLALAWRHVAPGPAAELLATRPEVVHAVHRRLHELTKEPQDPLELAAWLAGSPRT